MLDTNLCIRVLRERPAAIGQRFQQEAETLCISTIVLHELLFGAAKSDRPSFHRKLVDEFTSRLVILPFDAAASEHAADIKLNLSRRGQLIGPNDLLIAGHVRSLGVKLITGNLGEFKRVDGLRCEDWLNDS